MEVKFSATGFLVEQGHFWVKFKIDDLATSAQVGLFGICLACPSVGSIKGIISGNGNPFKHKASFYLDYPSEFINKLKEHYKEKKGGFDKSGVFNYSDQRYHIKFDYERLCYDDLHDLFQVSGFIHYIDKENELELKIYVPSTFGVSWK